jgi:hypothetical protein
LENGRRREQGTRETDLLAHLPADIEAERLDLREEVHLDESHASGEALLVTDDVQVRVSVVSLRTGRKERRSIQSASGLI